MSIPITSRRGGQLLTRVRSSSCASACPHFRAPGASVPDARSIHPDPRIRAEHQHQDPHTGYQSHRAPQRRNQETHRVFDSQIRVTRLAVSCLAPWCSPSLQSACGLTHRVKLPQRRSPASYSCQFVTLNYILLIRCRREALCPNGILGQSSYFRSQSHRCNA